MPVNINRALKRLGFVNGRDYQIAMVYPETEEGQPPPAGVATLTWLADPNTRPADEAIAAADEAETKAAYRRDREEAYIAELGKEPVPSFRRTVGDVLDTLIGQVEAIRLHSGAGATPAWTVLLTKIAAIKADHPKPPEEGEGE